MINNNPNLSSYDELIQLAVIADYPKKVLDAIAADPNTAAAIIHVARRDLEETLNQTPNLADLIDTEAGASEISTIRSRINALTINIAQPLSTTDAAESQAAFGALNTHVLNATTNLIAKRTVAGAPVSPPIGPAPAPGGPAPAPGGPTPAPGGPGAGPPIGPANIPQLRQDLEDEENRLKTGVITDPAILAALSSTLDGLKLNSHNDPDIVDQADKLLNRETLKHNEYVRVAAMPTRKLIQAAIDVLENKKAGNELDNLPDEDRQALIEAAERVKDTKPPNLNSTDFIAFLDIKPNDHSPTAEAIRRFIQERLDTNPNFEFEGFRDFIKDPSSLTAALIAQERQKLAPLEKSIRDAERTIAALEKERSSYTTSKGSSVTEVKQAQDQITAKISQLQDTVDKAKTDKQPIDEEIARLEKITLGDKRKLSPRGQLEMLYLYMDAKIALENKDDLDRDKVNEKANNAIKAIEKEQRDNVGSWEQFVRKVFGSLRPDLESTLKATQAKDAALSDIPADHMAKLAEIADDPQELNDWVQALPGDETKRMETYIPKLMGYLKVMVNSGGKAKVNNEGIESANKLLQYFDGIELAYATKKAAETPGKPIDQMIAFSNCRNATEATANDARQKIIDEHLDLKWGTQLAEAVVDKTSKAGFIGLTLLQSPLVAALGVGPAVTAYLALRGVTTKDEAEKKRMKKYAIAMGISTALASGGIALTGVGAIPILGMVTGVKALQYTYKKNKVKAKRLAGNTLNILSLGLFSGSKTIQKLLTAK